MFGDLGNVIVHYGAIRHEDTSQIKARDNKMGKKMVQMFESPTWLMDVQDAKAIEWNGRI
jgi:hypothetical protein